VPDLLTNLFGGFEIVIKLFLVQAILGFEKGRQFSFALLEVGRFATAHVLDSVTNDALLDQLGRRVFPMGS
jgi:hypothetical protein